MAYRPCSDCPLKTCSKCAKKSTRHKTGQRKKSRSRTSAVHPHTVRAVHKAKPVSHKKTSASLFHAPQKHHSTPLFRLPQKRGHTSVSMVCFSEIPSTQMSPHHPRKTEQSVRGSMDVPHFTEYVPQATADAAVGDGKPPVRKVPVDFDVPEIWEFGFPDASPGQQQPRRVSILRQIQSRVRYLLAEVSSHILPMIAGHFTAAALPPHEHEKDALPPHEKMELVIFTGNGKVVKK